MQNDIDIGVLKSGVLCALDYGNLEGENRIPTKLLT